MEGRWTEEGPSAFPPLLTDCAVVIMSHLLVPSDLFFYPIWCSDAAPGATHTTGVTQPEGFYTSDERREKRYFNKHHAPNQHSTYCICALALWLTLEGTGRENVLIKRA